MDTRVPPVRTLPTKRLGITDMDITRVGFGAWAIGGGGWTFGWGPQDDADSLEAIRHALELGINWIDTAAAYGLGHSEELVAQSVSTLSAGDRPYIFTKCGLIWDERDRMAPLRRVGRPDSIRHELDSSLRRLRVERIDLYQMHWPPEDGTPIEEYWGTLLDLKQAGKIRAAGLSNHSVAQLEAAEAIGHVDSLQPHLSLIKRDAAPEIAWCAQHQTGVIVYSPMHSGLLTGSFTPERTKSLPPDDWRSRSPDFTGEGLMRNLALVDALRPIAARHGTSIGALAVAWTLAWPGVTGAIVGARNAQQVDGWIGAANLTLTRDDLAEIAAAITRTGAGSGPLMPS